MKKAAKAVSGKDVETYLASLPKDQRVALQKLRKLIKSIAPEATERVSFRIPVFYHNGMLVGYAAFKAHLSFMVMGTTVMKKNKAALKDYVTATATIHFTPEKPLPDSLVKKLVKERMEENDARALKRKKK